MELWQGILDFDRELFLYLNSFYNDFWDTIMLMITRKETWIPFYMVIIYYIIKTYRERSILILLFLAITIVASDQVSVLIKNLIQRLRPVHDPLIEHMVHNVLRKGGLYGFVSSHAANTFAIFAFTSRIFKNKSYTVLLFFWTLMVSYSRIYSGVHYPFDILFGMLLGWMLASLMLKIRAIVEGRFFGLSHVKSEKEGLSFQDVGIIYFVFILMSVMVLITTYILHRFNYL
jgi:undecaprenyl-diphosphatase